MLHLIGNYITDFKLYLNEYEVRKHVLSLDELIT
jgi:hypothetical protein